MTLSLDKSTWKRVAFGDVVRNVNETVRDLEAAGIERIIAMEHMDPGKLKISRWGSAANGTTFTRRVKPGQTLFGKRRAYQRKVAYADFDAICSGDIYTFKADESQMLSEFLPFLVQSEEFFTHALGTSAGSLSPRTNWRDLANFEFDLPPLDEQKRIADLLWTLEHHQRALRTLAEALAHAIRQYLSTQFESGDDDLSTHADVLVGYAFPSRSFSRAPTGTSRRLLRGINIGVGVTRWEADTTVHWEPELTERTARYMLAEGDVVIPMDRPFTAEGRLRWARINASEADALLVQRVARLRPRDAKLASLIRGVIRSEAFQLSLNGSLTGSFAPHLAHGDFIRHKFDVRTPDVTANDVLVIEEAEARLGAEAETLTLLRSSLMSQYFGGS